MRARIFQIVAAWVFLTVACVGQEHEDLGRFEDFETSDRVWMASMLGEVAVNPKVELEAHAPGAIEWRVEDGEAVSEGDVVAICGREKLRLMERDLNIRRRRFHNDMLDREDANMEARNSLVAALREAEEKLGKMSMTEGERRLLGEEFEARLENEREEVRKDIERIRKKLDGDYFEVSLAAERQALQLELDKAESEYRDLLRSSELLSPVDGIVRIHERGELREPGPVGEVERRGFAELVVELTNPKLRDLPGESLVARVAGPDGRWYEATYKGTVENLPMARNTRMLAFDLGESEDGAKVTDELTGKRAVRLFRRLETSGKVVPKADLLFRFPDEIREKGWAGFVESRWKGVRVVFVGPRDLVVKRADED